MPSRSIKQANSLTHIVGSPGNAEIAVELESCALQPIHLLVIPLLTETQSVPIQPPDFRVNLVKYRVVEAL